MDHMPAALGAKRATIELHKIYQMLIERDARKRRGVVIARLRAAKRAAKNLRCAALLLGDKSREVSGRYGVSRLRQFLHSWVFSYAMQLHPDSFYKHSLFLPANWRRRKEYIFYEELCTLLERLNAAVSTALLRNLEELQEVWAMWRPSSYAPVPVTAAEERDGLPKRPPKTGVFAFSGGVDGTAALLRHHAGKMNRRTIQPIAAVMIHGFDIPLSKGPAFDTARAAAEAIIAKNKALLPLRPALEPGRRAWNKAVRLVKEALQVDPCRHNENQ